MIIVVEMADTTWEKHIFMRLYFQCYVGTAQRLSFVTLFFVSKKFVFKANTLVLKFSLYVRVFF
jgi:hypothetical protein